MKSFYCFITMLTPAGVNDLVADLVRRKVQVTSIGDELVDAREGHIGCVLTIKLTVEEENKAYHKTEEKCRSKVYELMKEVCENFGIRYLSLVVTAAQGATWATSTLPDQLKEHESMGGPYR